MFSKTLAKLANFSSKLSIFLLNKEIKRTLESFLSSDESNLLFKIFSGNLLLLISKFCVANNFSLIKSYFLDKKSLKKSWICSKHSSKSLTKFFSDESIPLVNKPIICSEFK